MAAPPRPRPSGAPLGALVLLLLALAAQGVVHFTKVAEPFATEEEGTAAYKLKLTSEPSVEVVVDLASADALTSLDSSRFVFNQTNWFVPQTLRITGINDNFILPSPYVAVMSLSATSPDPNFQIPASPINVLVVDTDVASVSIQSADDFPYPDAIPEGRFQNFDLVLTAMPQGQVTIAFAVLTPTIAVAPASLDFTPLSWNVSQRFTITAVDDTVANPSPHAARLAISSNSTLDPNFAAASIPNFEVLLEDNDVEAALRHGVVTWTATPSGEHGISDVRFVVEVSIAAPVGGVAPAVGATFGTSGSFEFGDRSELATLNFTVVHVAPGTALTGRAVLEHRYALLDSGATQYRATLSQCCRTATLLNNAETARELVVDLNLAYASESTLLGSLPTVFAERGAIARFTLPAQTRSSPLHFRLAGPAEYGEGRTGAPPGLTINPASGAVAWPTAGLASGDWHAAVVVTDLTGPTQSVLELLLTIPANSTGSTPALTDSPDSLILLTPGVTASHTFGISGGDGVVAVVPASDLPEGVNLTGSTLVWTPTAAQAGALFAPCFYAVDADGDVSLPLCLDSRVDVALSTATLLLGATSVTFEHGTNASVAAFPGATVSANTTLEFLYATLTDEPDVAVGVLSLLPAAALDPALTVTTTSTSLTVTGTAAPAAYQAVLDAIVFQHGGQPTPGARSAHVQVGTSDVATPLATVAITVAVPNLAPVIAVGTAGSSGFAAVFIPNGAPVLLAAPAPDGARITDAESDVASATVAIQNAQDGPDEVIADTLAGAPFLQVPVVRSSAERIEFGRLDESVQSVIDVTDVPGAVAKVDVVLDIRHSWVGDLDISLGHGGRTITLVTAPGGPACSQDDLVHTTFSAAATVQLAASAADPGFCRFQTRGVFRAPLEQFAGFAAGGAWTLTVTDLQDDLDDGIILGWALVLTTGPEAVEFPASLVPAQTLQGADPNLTFAVDITERGRVADIVVELGVAATNLSAVTATLTSPGGASSATLFTNAHCSQATPGFLVFSESGVRRLSEPADLANSGQPLPAGQSAVVLAFNTSALELAVSPEELAGKFRLVLGSQLGLDHRAILVRSLPTADAGGLLEVAILVPAANAAATQAAATGLVTSGVLAASLVDFGLAAPASGALELAASAIETTAAGSAPASCTAAGGVTAVLASPEETLLSVIGSPSQGRWTITFAGPATAGSLTVFSLNVRIVTEPNIDLVFDAATSSLALTGLDSPTNYARVLSSLTYTNLAASPSIVTREISFVVTDAGGLVSANATTLVSINHLVPVALTSILEDDTASTGDLVDDIILAATPASAGFSVASGSLGVGVVDVDEANGSWEVSLDGGVSFATLTNVSETAALALGPLGTFVRFVPDPDFNGEANITLVAWDFGRSALAPGSTGADALADPTFGREQTVATIVVEAVNDSPVVTAGPVLASIREDPNPLFNIGDQVGDILSGFYTDVDVGAVHGIAVVEVDRRNGDWTWTCDGVNINAFDPVVAEGAAQLLTDACRVRFTPNANFNSEFDLNGTAHSADQRPFISFKGWDNTGATLGLVGSGGINTTAADPTNEFSAGTVTAAMQVQSQNDIPVLLLDAPAADFAAVFLEDHVAVPLVNLATLSLIDVDHAGLASVSVVLVSAVDGVDEVLLVQAVPAIAANLSHSAGAATLTLLPSAGASASVADFEAVLRTLTYNNTAVEATPGSRLIEVAVSDGLDTSVARTIALAISAFNDLPVLDLNGPAANINVMVAYEEGSQVRLASPAIQIQDNDHANLSSATVRLLNPLDGDAELLLANVTIPTIAITTANATLTLSGSAPLADYEAVLGGVEYRNTLADVARGNPTRGTRRIEFVVSDGAASSIAAFALVAFSVVNDEPFVDLSDGSGFDFATSFVEGDGPVSVTAGDATVFDIDNATLASLVLTITNPLDGASESLDFLPALVEVPVSPGVTSTLTIDPSASYDPATGSLTFVGLDTVAQYELILRQVRYNNLAQEPNATSRVISVVASDGLLVSETRLTTIGMVESNDSPFFVAGATPFVPSILEDETAGAGFSVAALASALLGDNDRNARLGLAITAVDDSNGVWQRFDAGVSLFVGIGSAFTSPDNALLVEAVAGETLRFVPNPDFHGTVTLTAVAYDFSDGRSPGDRTNATSTSGRDAFSPEALELELVVQPVNDAPSFGNGMVELTTIDEDAVTVGDRVDALLAQAAPVDQDDVLGLAPTVFGAVLVGADTTNGAWEVSVDGGASYTTVGLVSRGSGVLLAGDSLVRFVPRLDFHETATATFVVSDGTNTSSGAAGTTGVDTTFSATGAFSSGEVVATIVVEAVNDSPVIIAAPAERVVTEDPSVSSDVSVSALVLPVAQDVDLSPQLGIAVVEVDRRGGNWFHSCSGANFVSFIGGFQADGSVFPLNPSASDATLLFGASAGTPSCRIRFVPNANFNSEFDLNGNPWPVDMRPFLRFKAWDRTNLTAPDGFAVGIDTTSTSTTDEFSEATATLFFNFSSVNDPPVVRLAVPGPDATATFVEDQGAVALVDAAGLTVADVDHALIQSANVTITNAVDGGAEVLAVVTATTGLASTLTISGSTVVLQLTPAGPKGDFQLALRTLTYDNTAVEATPGTRVIEVAVSDGLDTSVARTIALAISAFNDLPVLDLNGPAVAGLGFNVEYTEGLEVEVVDAAALSVTDTDSPNLALTSVQLLDRPDGADELLTADTSGTLLSATYSASNGTLLIAGSAPLADYEAVLRTVNYTNSRFNVDRGNPTPSQRRIEFVVSDGEKSSLVATSRITFAAVNDEPFVDLSGGSPGEDFATSFVEGDGPVSVTAGDATVFDIDNATLASLVLTITNPLDGASESLDFLPALVEVPVSPGVTSTLTIDPSASYDPATGSLTFVGLDTVAQYELILRQVRYNNLAQEPNATSRVISVVASDGLLVSETRLTTIGMVESNDSPFFVAGATPFVPSILEDETAGAGFSVAALASALLGDNDRNARLGLAITAVDDSNGVWQRFDAGVSLFVGIGSAFTSPDNALLVEAVAGETLRFVPNPDFHGTVTLTAVAYDFSDGRSPGDRTNATSTSGRDAFSPEALELELVVQPVNDAPSFGNGMVELTTIDEDAVTVGDRVDALLAQAAPVDQDDVLGLAPTVFGAVLVGADTTNGAWEVSVDGGASYTTVGLVSRGSGVLLAGDSLVRFVPRLDFHETATATFVVSDGTNTSSGAAGTTGVDTTFSATGAFSSGEVVATIVVEAVNDSPVVVAGAALLPIDEEAAVNAGTNVSTVVALSYSDVDLSSPSSGAGVQLGIAVVEVDRRNGDWLYACGSDPFVPFIGGVLENNVTFPPDPSETKATLLDASCRIQFVPNADFNSEFDLDGFARPASDTPFLRYRGWDQTGVSCSGDITVDTTVPAADPTSEFSASVEAATILVRTQNDAPVVDLGGTGGDFITLFTEGQNASTPVAHPQRSALSDRDHANFQGLSVVLQNVLDPGFEALVVTLNVSSGLTATPTATGLNLTSADCAGCVVAVDLLATNTTFSFEARTVSGLAPSALYLELLRATGYANTHPEPANATRAISVVLDDGLDTSVLRTTALHVRLVLENKPVITLAQTAFSVAEEAGAIAIGPNATLFDEDHNEFFPMAGLSVAQVNTAQYVAGTDFLSVVPASPALQQAYNASTGALEISGLASVADYQTTLRSLTFLNNESEPQGYTRTLVVLALDTAGLVSDLREIDIAVELLNDNRHVVSALVPEFVLLEDRDFGADVGLGFALSDADTGGFNFSSATVALEGGLVGESLSLEGSLGVPAGIVAVGNGSQTITLSGPAPLGAFEVAVRAVTYASTLEEPGSGVRRVNVTLVDDAFTVSATSDLRFLEVNDLPLVSLADNGTRVFAEGPTPVAVFRGVAITDNDDTVLASASIAIVDPRDGAAEQLLANSTASLTVSPAGNGSLVVTGPGALAEFAALVERVVYLHSNSQPGNPTAGIRSVRLVVSDGGKESVAVLGSVVVEPVNDSPVVAVRNETRNATFVEEGPAVAVFSAGSVSVADVDSPLLAYAFVEVANGQDAGFESLDASPAGAVSVTTSTLEVCTLLCLRANASGVVHSQFDGSGGAAEQDGSGEDDGSGANATVLGSAPGGDGSGDGSGDDALALGFCEASCTSGAQAFALGMGCAAACGADPECAAACGRFERAGFMLYLEGPAPAADFEATIATVTYQNTKDEPSIEPTREITVVVGDGLFGLTGMLESPIVSDFVALVAANDAPVLNVLDSAVAREFVEGDMPVALLSETQLLFGDDDDELVEVREVRLLNGADGAFEGLFLKGAVPGPLNATLVAGVSHYDTLAAQEFGFPAGSIYLPLQQSLTNLGLQNRSALAQTLLALRYVNLHQNPSVAAPRQIELTLADPQNATSNTTVLTVTVTAVDDPPLVDAASAPALLAFAEDEAAPGPRTISLLPFVYDDEARPALGSPAFNFSIRLANETAFGPAFGRVDILPSGDVEFVPEANDFGSRSFALEFCTAAGPCSAPFVVQVEIAAVNDPPEQRVAVLRATVNEDEETTIPLDQFYLDVEEYRLEGFQAAPVDGAAQLSVALPVQPDTSGHGTVFMDSAQRVLIFQGQEHFSGNVSVDVTVMDTANATTTMTLLILILPVNDPPIVPLAIGLQAVEDGSVTQDLTVAGTADIEDDRCPPNPGLDHRCRALQVNVSRAPVSGAVSLQFDDSVVPITGGWRFTYTPQADFSGADSFELLACDSSGACRATEVTVEVLPVADAPLVNVSNVAFFTVQEDQVLVRRLLDVVSDPDSVLSPGDLAVVVNTTSGVSAYNATSGIFRYTPGLHFFGADNFTLEVCSPDDGCSETVITINVLAVNDAPVTPNITLDVREDGSASLNFTASLSDQEDGVTDPARVLFGPATIGVLVYDNATGMVTYTGNPDANGVDRITYTACDAEGLCSSGVFEVTVLAVNDPPRLGPLFNASLPYAVDEDAFNLILAYLLHVDVDLGEVAPEEQLLLAGGQPDLLITVVSAPAQGVITPYPQYGILGYEPTPDFVGEDAFVYRVCDACSDSRNAELGRIAPSTDPGCVRERAAAASPAEVGCLTVSVPVRVRNINDPPSVQALLETASIGTDATFTPIPYTVDRDDAQRAALVSAGLDPAVFNFPNRTTDLDPASLSIVQAPASGTADVVGQTIVYTPPAGFTGYDNLTYSLCDLGGECASALAMVQVVAASPQIERIEAVGACTPDGGPTQFDLNDDSCDARFFTDGKYGVQDRIVVTFDQDTNMAPVNSANVTITPDQLALVLEFSQPLTRNRPVGFFGLWRNPRQLLLVVIDPGYPEPSPEIGSFTIRVAGDATRNCGQFNVTSPVLDPTPAAELHPGCLTDAAGASLHSTAVSGTLEGTWGLRLGQVSEVFIDNPAGVEADFFGEGTLVEVFVEPPLSAMQMFFLCQLGAAELFDLEQLGTGIQAGLNCNNVFADGTFIATSISQQEFDCLYKIDTLNATERTDCDSLQFESVPADPAAEERRRRREAAQEQPTQSRFVLEIMSLGGASVSPANVAAFFAAVSRAWNFTSVAQILEQNDGLDLQQEYLDYLNLTSVLPAPDPATSLYIIGDISRTPVVESIVGAGQSVNLTAGDTLLITFDRSTNAPSINADNTVGRADLDRLLTFSPTIGSADTDAYEGRWLSTRELLITVNKPPALGAILAAPQNMDVSFTPALLLTGGVSTDPCRGAQLCGMTATQWGICDAGATSCRASGTFAGASIQGDWGQDGSASVNNRALTGGRWWLLLLIILLVLLVLLLLAWLVYKYCIRPRHSKTALISAKVNQWKAGVDKKDSFPDTGEVWSRPPAMVAMRTNPDPFLNMPELQGDAAGAGAGAGAAGPSQSVPFAPRAGATIAPAMPFPGRSDKFPVGPGASNVPVKLPPLKPNRGGVSALPSRLPPLAKPASPNKVASLPPGDPRRSTGPVPATARSPPKRPSFAAPSFPVSGGVGADGNPTWAVPRAAIAFKRGMAVDPFARPQAAAFQGRRPTMPKRPSLTSMPSGSAPSFPRVTGMPATAPVFGQGLKRPTMGRPSLAGPSPPRPKLPGAVDTPQPKLPGARGGAGRVKKPTNLPGFKPPSRVGPKP